MKFHTCRVRNYKSVVDSLEVKVDRLTVLAGRNNSGKSATLEALFVGNATVRNDIPNDSKNRYDVAFDVEFTDDELLSVTQEAGDSRIQSNRMHIIVERHGLNVYLYSLCDNNGYSIQVRNVPGVGLRFVEHFGGREINLTSPITYSHPALAVIRQVTSSILYINGNRTVQRPMAIDTNEKNMASDASNLYSFFHNLSHDNEVAFNAIREKFSNIFPDVETFSVGLVANNAVQITVKMKGMDRSIPLYDCGSGFTHILTLLGVVYGETKPRLVLFDEPQSFLHPSAEKALYDQIEAQTSHQIVFTTHSAILLNYPMEKDVYLLKKDEGISTFMKLEQADDGLAELGVTNSDFAFANRVLFVEGQTEYKVIPILMEHFGYPQIGYNYVLIPLGKTGDEFKGALSLMQRNAQMYRGLFDNISDRKIPYKILLDRDERKTDVLGNAYEDKVILLQRRELENYFLIPEAIFTVIAQELEAHNAENDELTVEAVTHELDHLIQKTDDKRLYPKESTEPVKNVIGSRVLDVIFSKYLCQYSKPAHGQAFLTWLLKNQPDELNDFYEVLAPFLTSD